MRFLLALLLAAWALAAHAQPSFNTSDPFRAIPTFNSLGLYWEPPQKSAANRAQVEYKVQGAPDTQYKRGLDLWFDDRTFATGGQVRSEYRGSLVHLQPGTAYDLRLTLKDSSGATVGTPTLIPATETCANPTLLNRDVHCTKTWTENYTAQTAVQTLPVPAGTKQIVINPTSAGTASGQSNGAGTIYTISAPTDRDGYTRITGSTARQIIDGSGMSGACIAVNHGVRNVAIADFVIQNCTTFGIAFAGAGGSTETFTHNVVIDDNEFTVWGRLSQTTPFPLARNDGAVHCDYENPIPNSVPKPRRIVVQRNSFHDPRHPTNRWDQYAHDHPEGALAVRMMECGSNHVIRYNDVYTAANGNRFKDGFGDGGNDRGGAPGADSDIYANRIQDVYDDAIQAEGSNRNVRIWGNFIDRSYVAIANAPVVEGPLYVWRNVSNDMVMYDPAAADEDPDHRQPFIKGGTQDPGDLNGGRAYYFHNTILQPLSTHGNPYTRGAGYGPNSSGGDGDTPLYNFWSLNNIWHIHQLANHKSIRADCSVPARPCISDYDLYNGGLENAGSSTTGPAAEANGWGNSVPTYGSSFQLPSEDNGWSGNFALASGPGFGGAVELFNFNAQHGSSADVGAHQSGTPNMKFGRCAAGGHGCAVTAPPTTITLMQGLNYNGATDTRLNGSVSSQNTNYGTFNNLGFGPEAGNAILVRFKIFAAEGGPVPNGATITSATLSLYKWQGPSLLIKASRLKKNWVQEEATWNIPSSTTSWTTAGALSAGNDYETTADGQGSVGDATADGCQGATTPPPACWVNIDVTAGVQAFASGTTNYGWKLAQVGAGSSSTFNASEANGAGGTARPKLTITYSSP